MKRCLDSELSDKHEYTTYVRTVPSTAKVTRSLIALMKSKDWRSFSVIAEHTEEWNGVSRSLGATAAANGITVWYHLTSNQAAYLPSAYYNWLMISTGKYKQYVW